MVIEINGGFDFKITKIKGGRTTIFWSASSQSNPKSRKSSALPNSQLGRCWLANPCNQRNWTLQCLGFQTKLPYRRYPQSVQDWIGIGIWFYVCSQVFVTIMIQWLWLKKWGFYHFQSKPKPQNHLCFFFLRSYGNRTQEVYPPV